MLNRTCRLIFFLLSGCIAVANTGATEQNKTEVPLKPQDFAYAVPLQFEGQDALYQATLPLSVYQNTVRSDLGDLRVFNAQGEVVPHMLRQPERSQHQPAGAAQAGVFSVAGRCRCRPGPAFRQHQEKYCRHAYRYWQ